MIFQSRQHEQHIVQFENEAAFDSAAADNVHTLRARQDWEGRPVGVITVPVGEMPVMGPSDEVWLRTKQADGFSTGVAENLETGAYEGTPDVAPSAKLADYLDPGNDANDEATEIQDVGLYPGYWPRRYGSDSARMPDGRQGIDAVLQWVRIGQNEDKWGVRMVVVDDGRPTGTIGDFRWQFYDDDPQASGVLLWAFQPGDFVQQDRPRRWRARTNYADGLEARQQLWVVMRRVGQPAIVSQTRIDQRNTVYDRTFHLQRKTGA